MIKNHSIPILKAYWIDLMIKFEKSESEEVLKLLLLVEEELHNKEEQTCSLKTK
jgi:hypothetical protein